MSGGVVWAVWRRRRRRN